MAFGFLKKTPEIIATAFGIFIFLYAGFGTLDPVFYRNTVLSFGMLLTFLFNPLQSKRVPPFVCKGLDTFFIVLTVVSFAYLSIQTPDLADRQGVVYPLDPYFFVITVFLIFEASRRLMSLAVPVIAAIFLLYIYFGPYIPGLLGHSGQMLTRITSYVYLGPYGIYGTLLGTAASFIILFVVFGALLRSAGVDRIFNDIAFGLFGRTKGGPAKASVIASALFGMVSGSAASNVMVTGSFTIPLMKKAGYKDVYAGAVEATASSGGQIMPPIMGAGAFIMADILGLPYISVCSAALLPAILYFLSIFIAVDREAHVLGLKELPAEEAPSLKEAITRHGYLLLPIFVLIYFLAVRMASPATAGFWAIIACFLVGLINPVARKDFLKRVLAGFKSGARDSLMVILVCATAGIIVAAFGQTGLSLKLTTVLTELSGGNLLLLLILSMIAAIILGMGMPTAAAYVLVAILVAPAIAAQGVLPLAAHLFVFYFAVISAITPPVALAAFAASSISGAPAFKTGFTAMRIALPAFLIPYFFVINPALIMQGSFSKCLLVILTSIVGVFFLACSTEGFLWKPMHFIFRVFAFVGGILLIDPHIITDIIALLLLGITVGGEYFLSSLFWKKSERRREKSING